jgi:hypothetical protein
MNVLREKGKGASIQDDIVIDKRVRGYLKLMQGAGKRAGVVSFYCKGAVS